MRYQDNTLAQKHDVLYEKHKKCKENEKYIDPFSLSDIEYIKNAENELSLFEEEHLHEPMVFDNGHDDLSILLPIIRDNFNESFDPAYFYFENGVLRRPVLNDEERELIRHFLTPRMVTFTGRIGVHNWSSVDIDNLLENKVTVLLERRTKKVAD